MGLLEKPLRFEQGLKLTFPVWIRLVLVHLIFIPSFGYTTTYYVDSAAGNNSNRGISQAAPWQTIAKVNSFSFSSGDTILLKRGGLWREGLVIKTSNLTIGAYGTDNPPILSGAQQIPTSMWNIYGGGIYVTDLQLNALPTQLYINGVYCRLARYPNPDAGTSGYFLTTAASQTKDTFMVSNLSLSPGSQSLIGATIVARERGRSCFITLLLILNGSL